MERFALCWAAKWVNLADVSERYIFLSHKQFCCCPTIFRSFSLREFVEKQASFNYLDYNSYVKIRWCLRVELQYASI